MPNIDDVARIAGVHRSTVARVFSQGGSVSPECRKKVMAAAKKINYHVNTVAQALKSNKKSALGFISFWFASSKPTEIYYQQTLTGVVDGMTHSEYLLISKNIEGMLSKRKKELNFLHESMLGGVIIMSPLMNKNDLTFLKNVDIPVVLLYYRGEDTAASWVDMDNQNGARLAVEHLIGLGHRKIAFIGGDREDSTNAKDRYEGFRDALFAAGLKENPDWVKHGRFHIDYGKEVAASLLTLPVSRRPTAVFCATDMIAFGFIEAAKGMNVSVPGEISVVGFDDLNQVSLGEPFLTTIHHPFYEIGKKAVELLVEIIKSNSQTPRQILIEPKLIIRSSTAPPAE